MYDCYNCETKINDSNIPTCYLCQSICNDTGKQTCKNVDCMMKYNRMLRDYSHVLKNNQFFLLVCDSCHNKIKDDNEYVLSLIKDGAVKKVKHSRYKYKGDTLFEKFTDKGNAKLNKDFD